MDIVQPDHVRVEFPHPFEEGNRCPAGAEAAVIQQAAFQRMAVYVKIRTDFHRPNVVTAGFHPSVGQHAGVSLGIQLPAFVRRDAARAAIARHGVDEQVLHPPRLLCSQYFRQTILSTTPV